MGERLEPNTSTALVSLHSWCQARRVIAPIALALLPASSFSQSITVPQTASFLANADWNQGTQRVVNLPEFDRWLGSVNYSFRYSFTEQDRFAIAPATVVTGPVVKVDTFVTLRLAETFGRSEITDHYDTAPFGFCAAQLPQCQITSFGVIYNLGRATLISAAPGFYGGPIAFLFRADLTEYQVPVSGAWQMSGTVTATQRYTPKSVQQYVVDSVGRSIVGSDVSSVRAQAAYSLVISMRESSAQTSSQNTRLRDAEYFLRGYSGGALFREINNFDTLVLNPGNDSWASVVANLIFDTSAAVNGVAAYNGVKSALGAFGRNISGGSALPATPPGGESFNALGFKRGLAAEPMAPNATSLIAESRATTSTLSNASGANVSLPDPTTVLGPKINSFAREILFQQISLAVAAPSDRLVLLNLPIAQLMALALTGNKFGSVRIPDTLGDSTIELFVAGQSFAATAGQTFDFTAIDTAGVTDFIIGVGAEDSAVRLDGLEIGVLSANNFDLYLISATVAVPEPASAVLLVSGLLGLLYRRNSKRRPSP